MLPPSELRRPRTPTRPPSATARYLLALNAVAASGRRDCPAILAAARQKTPNPPQRLLPSLMCESQQFTQTALLPPSFTSVPLLLSSPLPLSPLATTRTSFDCPSPLSKGEGPRVRVFFSLPAAPSFRAQAAVARNLREAIYLPPKRLLSVILRNDKIEAGPILTSTSQAISIGFAGVSRAIAPQGEESPGSIGQGGR